MGERDKFKWEAEDIYDVDDSEAEGEPLLDLDELVKEQSTPSQKDNEAPAV